MLGFQKMFLILKHMLMLNDKARGKTGHTLRKMV